MIFIITLNTTLIPILKENGIGFRYIGGIYDPMTIIITHKSIDICRVDMNCNSCEPYNYNVYWFASVVKNASDLRKQYLMSQTLIDDINKAIYFERFERGENKMDECNFSLIVFWSDGTKTVVKAENEEFDPEKGLAMAIAKRALGNNYGYYDTFKKYVGRYEKKQKKGDK